jgi:hypothetical protein
MVFAFAGIGVVAGFAARHPFDYVWNHGVRRVLGAPALPPNPPRRRLAFKIATAWLLVVGTLFTVGAATAANLCLPSEALAWWERRATSKEPLPT